MSKRIYKKLERVDWFMSQLSAIAPDDRQAIWGLCMREMNHLQNDLWKPPGSLTLQAGYKDTTLRSTLTLYRSAVRGINKNHLALKFLRPSAAAQRSYQVRYHRSLKQEQRDQRPVLPDELVDTAIEILRTFVQQSAPVKKELVIDAIELLTGRRGWEIAKVGRFLRAKRIPAALSRAKTRVLLFEGQAKTKDSPNARHRYHIPVLAPTELILTAYNELHRRYPLLRRIARNKDYNRNEGKRAAELCKKRFFDARMPQRTPLTPKDLRECYGLISFMKYRPQGMTINVWISDHLGHIEEDVTTFNAYQGFTILGRKREIKQLRKVGIEGAIGSLERKRKAARTEERQQHLDGKIALFKRLISKDYSTDE